MASSNGGNMQIEETAGTPNKFIVLRQEVIDDKNLTLAEKFVYVRICQFDEYFESCKEAGALLGLSMETVKKAKQKLVKLGYIMETTNTGRGKRYKAKYDLENAETGKIYPSDGYNLPLRRVKSTRRVIELEKKENNCIDKSIQLGENAEHGNHDINEMFDAWNQTFGFEQKQSAENRRACYNLMRRKDLGKQKLLTLIQVLDEAQKDRFATREIRGIVGFASLQSNLPHLMMWARRKYSQHTEQGGIEI